MRWLRYGYVVLLNGLLAVIFAVAIVAGAVTGTNGDVAVPLEIAPAGPTTEGVTGTDDVP